MKYFVYILRMDSGFAPNPFHGFCTLATCKPKIRKAAKEGDWIIGLGSRNQNNLRQNYQGRLIYTMKVTKKITFNQYWQEKIFQVKKPNQKSAKGKCGDNMYYKNSKGYWIQKKSWFHYDEQTKKTDTSADSILVSNCFFYFEKEHIDIPDSFKKEINKSWRQRKHKILIDQSWRNYKYLDEKTGKRLIEWLSKKYIKAGRYGEPIGYEIKKGCSTKKPYKTNISCQGYRAPSKSCS